MLLIHAPNIHTGGGLVLLRAVLLECNFFINFAQLDIRANRQLAFPFGGKIHFVNRSIFSRIYAEWRLFRAAKTDDVVLSFHGLPPLFPTRAKVVVFIQNRLLIDSSSLAEYPLNIRLRLEMERLWCSLFQSRCSRYIVQTP
jgi:hypothetical protein